MANPGSVSSRSVRQSDIRVHCQRIVAAGVNGDRLGAHNALAALRRRLDLPRIGPLMADVFAESIHRGCRALGAVTNHGLPDVDRFLPDTTQAPDAAPEATARAVFQARQIHRADSHTARKLIATYATQGPMQARLVYQRDAIQDKGEQLLVMLLATAINVQRQVQAAGNADRAGRESG